MTPTIIKHISRGAPSYPIPGGLTEEVPRWLGSTQRSTLGADGAPRPSASPWQRCPCPEIPLS